MDKTGGNFALDLILSGQPCESFGCHPRHAAGGRTFLNVSISLLIEGVSFAHGPSRCMRWEHSSGLLCKLLLRNLH